jgi:hypothetical protein
MYAVLRFVLLYDPLEVGNTPIRHTAVVCFCRFGNTGFERFRHGNAEHSLIRRTVVTFHGKA